MNRITILKSRLQKAVTLMELLVVILIITILSTIATNVYTGQVQRAKVAATLSTIRDLSVGIVRHEIDTGELPLSGSGVLQQNLGGVPSIGNRNPPANLSSLNQRVGQGNGWLYLALVHSMSGSSTQPYPSTWAGPYLEFNSDIIKTLDDNGAVLPFGSAQILDSFGYPFEYVNHLEYNPAVPLPLNKHFDITGVPAYPGQGTEMWAAAKPGSAHPDLPANNPFEPSETYYNPATFQIFSVGRDTVTYDGQAGTPPSDDPGAAFGGAQSDDINNFGY